jgi:hypothetical protein
MNRFKMSRFTSCDLLYFFPGRLHLLHIPDRDQPLLNSTRGKIAIEKIKKENVFTD